MPNFQLDDGHQPYNCHLFRYYDFHLWIRVQVNLLRDHESYNLQQQLNRLTVACMQTVAAGSKRNKRKCFLWPAQLFEALYLSSCARKQILISPSISATSFLTPFHSIASCAKLKQLPFPYLLCLEQPQVSTRTQQEIVDNRNEPRNVCILHAPPLTLPFSKFHHHV